MHEVGIAMQIVELATERANGAHVHRVVIEVGDLTAVLPDALAFAWDAVTEGTAIAGAVLEIATVTGHELKIRTLEVSHATVPHV